MFAQGFIARDGAHTKRFSDPKEFLPNSRRSRDELLTWANSAMVCRNINSTVDITACNSRLRGEASVGTGCIPGRVWYLWRVWYLCGRVRERCFGRAVGEVNQKPGRDIG